MHRFFARITGDRAAELLPEEEAHALKVLRMRAGDPCQILADGAIYAAHIVETAPRVTAALEKELPTTEPGVRLTLYQGVPKGDKMDYIAQKCTEAGAARIVPVHFSRCVAQWTGKDAEKKTARFQRIAAEAAKQSGRALTPVIEPPIAFGQLTQRLPRHEMTFVPWEEASGRGMGSFWQGQRDVGIVIGPEGGIAPEEIAALQGLNAVPVTLGPRIFRTETAGLAAIVSLLTLSGDMGR
ncbi:MAG: 16S rRNA (uracil(1498)-N(3))-methyltransferase [Clostridia bacterium]|nr:16S rRNA (uracil(1498)-N(3))-methyltransferase [Clostridia bacterium]